MERHKFQSVGEFIGSFPKDTQAVLEKIRSTIQEAVPEADQVISYNIPCFKLNGKYLVYFAGFERHVSVYPIPDDKELLKELKPHIKGKGTLQFPLDKPIPYDLIKKVALSFKKIRSKK